MTGDRGHQSPNDKPALWLACLLACYSSLMPSLFLWQLVWFVGCCGAIFQLEGALLVCSEDAAVLIFGSAFNNQIDARRRPADYPRLPGVSFHTN